MQSTCIVRKVDKLGRIVIPVDLREKLNLHRNIEIFSKNHSIYLRQHIPRCTFCDNENIVKTYQNANICQNCFNKIDRIIE